MLPRVLILYTGGTFGMDIHRSSKDGNSFLAIPNLSSASLKKRLYERVPELNDLARCDVDILLNRDSSHIGPAEWVLIAKRIEEKWDKYDGFVVLHGTDTLAYTASALSFLLRPCRKPVILTGAQRPLSALRTDARTNLISAVEIAAHGPRNRVNQVCVFFGDSLLQGNRIRKRTASDFDAFECPHSPPLARVGTTIRYSDAHRTPASFKGPLEPTFNQRVLIAHITPGFPSQSFSAEYLEQFDAIVLVIFMSGTAPTHDPSFLHFLKLTRKRKIPVIITTEGISAQPGPEKQKIKYAAGKDLLSENTFWAGQMTLECAYVKTCLLLGQSRDLERFAYLWSKNLAHEGV